jgi:hypothetical protein
MGLGGRGRGAPEGDTQDDAPRPQPEVSAIGRPRKEKGSLVAWHQTACHFHWPSPASAVALAGRADPDLYLNFHRIFPDVKSCWWLYWGAGFLLPDVANHA